MKCRHCGSVLDRTFIDLGSAPPSNAYLTAEALLHSEKWYPLKVMVCDRCWLVQTMDFVGAADLFHEDYAYFSSVSETWVAHARRYVDAMVSRFDLADDSYVVEVAANDGYLLQFFRDRGIPCCGIEPTLSTAAAARQKDLEIITAFFNGELAEELVCQGRSADLMVANNVLAHVPAINDFISGFAVLLKPDGVATFEFPHLVNLVAERQFDTIYHEHFSYLSLTVVERVFSANGLQIFDVEPLVTHGGSVRVFAQRGDSGKHPVTAAVADMLAQEAAAGVTRDSYYGGLQEAADAIKADLLRFLLETRKTGKKVAAYGAAAKGNTLLNYAGIRPDLLPYVADRSPGKQNKYLPGSRIPIVDETHLRRDRPDCILVLPWNIRSEIVDQLAYAREWGASFVTAIPELRAE